MKRFSRPRTSGVLLFLLPAVALPAQAHLMRANMYVVCQNLAGALQEINEWLKLDVPGP